jgi:hypothetical protein
MSSERDLEASRKEVLASLTTAISALSRVKSRLPLLQALAKELNRIAAGRDIRARNGLVLQMAHDSLDMLVIDLHSLREHMLTDRGVFKVVAKHCRLLRRFTTKDVDNEGAFLGPAEDEASWQDSYRTWMVERWNEIFDRVFPGRTTVKEKHVERLRIQFKLATQPIQDDRHKVRAHRYAGHHGSDDVKAAFLSLDKVAAQIEVFKRYLNDLLFLVSKSRHAMNTFGNAETTAEDVADLIVYGSINWATIEYGMAPKQGIFVEGVPPWYWYYRKKFYEDRALLAEQEGDEDANEPETD